MKYIEQICVWWTS